MKVFKWFPPKKNSLGNRIFVLTMTITLSMVALLGFTFSYLSTNIIKDHLQTVLVAIVDSNAIEIENLLDNALKNALRITNDPKIQAVLRNPRPESIAEAYSLELEMDNQLSFVQNYVDHLFGFYIIGANGMQFKSNFSSPIYQDWKDFDWYQRIIASDSPVWFDPHEGSFTVNTIGQPLVTMGLRIMDKSTGNILGALLTDIEVSTLSSIVRKGMGETGHFILTSSDKSIISQSANETNNSEYSFSYTKDISLAGWELTGYLHPSLIENSVLSMITPILILIAIIAIIVLFASSSISYRITAQLRELASLMEVVQSGNFRVTMDTSGDDEVALLGSTFNVMVSQINNLLRDLHDEHEKLRIAEMKTLEAQINPHFLYNTLDSIIWLARKGKMDDVTRLVYSLSKLLRIGLNRGRTMVTIEEEIEHITNYLIIQEVRYADDFIYEIIIPDSILKNKTLKLILQPLVENAIIHGVQQSDTSEKITIVGEESGTDILIRVTNSGPQVPQDRLDEINLLLEEGSESDFGLGLRNVNERIKLYFGQQYGLHFSSNSEGTTVIVHIPRI